MVKLHGFALGFGLLGLATAFGQFTPIPQPTPAYTGGTTMYLITTPNGNSMGTTLTQGSQTLTLSNALQAATIGSGWANWASPPNTEGAAGTRVGIYVGSLTSYTITLSEPTTTFGFEWEPNNGTSTMTATFYNGATALGTITQSVGYTAARLYAATSTTPITSVSLSFPDTGGGGFAFARFRFATTSTETVPALGPVGLCVLAILLLGAGAMFVRKPRAAA